MKTIITALSLAADVRQAALFCYRSLAVKYLWEQDRGGKQRPPARRRQTMKLFLTEIALGRVLLHLGCVLRGGRWSFHWCGVRRELRHLLRGMRACLKSSGGRPACRGGRHLAARKNRSRYDSFHNPRALAERRRLFRRA